MMDLIGELFGEALMELQLFHKDKVDNMD